jgi:hypothetical protein
MGKTRQAQLIETLDIDRLREVGAKIAGLPAPEEFKNKVEDDLWQTFTGRQNAGNSVAYDSLSDESKSVIGYVESETGEQFIPWWLVSFEWKASSRGEKITLQRGNDFDDELSKLENFDPKATAIHKPSFRNPHNRQTILDVLEGFEDLFESLDERITIDGSSTELSLPSDIFEIEGRSVGTTSSFEAWFNSLIGICPPVNSELTALLMVNTGVRLEAVEDVVPAELLETIDDLEISNGRIFEREYHQPLKKILDLGQVLDLVIPGTEKFDELGGLEGLFYENWAETYSGNKEIGQWVSQADDWNPDSLDEGQEPIFGSIAFSAPLRLKRRKPIFTTLRLYSPNSDKSGYYQSDRGKRREVADVMGANGYLEE